MASRFLVFFVITIVLSSMVIACSLDRDKTRALSESSSSKKEHPESEAKNKSVPSKQGKGTVSSASEGKSESKLLPALEIISQSSSYGKTKVFIANKKGFVSTGVVEGIHIPPYNKVYFLSHENKSCFIWDVKKPYPFAHFTKQPVAIRRPFVKVGVEKILGYKCTVYQDFKDSKKASLRYVFTRDIDAPSSMLIGYSSSFGNPASFGIPMLLKAKYRNGWIKLLEVVEVNRVKVNEHIFDVPDYKEVKDLVNFAFFTPGSEDIENLFEYHFDKKKKRKN